MSAGPRLARRTALGTVAGAVAGVVVLAGCEGNGSEPGDMDAPAAEADPDVALVDGVLAELTRVRAIASSAGVPDVVALHDAHLEALSGARTSPSASPSASTSPPPTPGSVRVHDLWRHERALQGRLVEAAVAARSGALAALLASMSAAQAQVLAEATVPR